MRYLAIRSNSAIRLREAAYRFAGITEPIDAADRSGISATRNLLACAIRYADAESRARIDRARSSGRVADASLARVRCAHCGKVIPSAYGDPDKAGAR